MAFGVALALLFPRLFWVFLCLGFWIAASRPFIGVHYPSDMLAGGLLGGSDGMAPRPRLRTAAAHLRLRRKRPSGPPQGRFGAALAAAGTTLRAV